MLKTTADDGSVDWLYQPVVVANSFHDPDSTAGTDAGLNYAYYDRGPQRQVSVAGVEESPAISLAGLAQQNPAATGIAPRIDASLRRRDDNYAIVFDGFLNVPADGGYTFMLLARDEARLEIDSVPVAFSPKPFAQVCGSPGNAVQAATGSIGLRAGRHAIRISMTHTAGPNDFAVKWQEPGLTLSDIPATALSH